jgi:hypothetical protein
VKLSASLAVGLALVVVGCGASAVPSATPTAAPATSTPAPATPAATPSPTAAAPAPASPDSTSALAAASELEGTWSAGATTCEQQNAALAKAGFTPKDLKRGGWDSETCGNMMHGRLMMARFAGDQLTFFQDGVSGWNGTFAMTGPGTFKAGVPGDLYLAYTFTLDGDRLTVDMVRDDYPADNDNELLGEQIAQTVVWESAPFMRQ